MGGDFSFGMPNLIELSESGETVELCRRLGLDFVGLSMRMANYCSESLGRATEMN